MSRLTPISRAPRRAALIFAVPAKNSANRYDLEQGGGGRGDQQTLHSAESAYMCTCTRKLFIFHKIPVKRLASDQAVDCGATAEHRSRPPREQCGVSFLYMYIWM